MGHWDTPSKANNGFFLQKAGRTNWGSDKTWTTAAEAMAKFVRPSTTMNARPSTRPNVPMWWKQNAPPHTRTNVWKRRKSNATRRGALITSAPRSQQRSAAISWFPSVTMCPTSTAVDTLSPSARKFPSQSAIRSPRKCATRPTPKPIGGWCDAIKSLLDVLYPKIKQTIQKR